MHETSPFIGRLRRRLRSVLPRAWLAGGAPSGPGLRPRRLARARMELDAASPATSWVAWEVSRSRRPAP